jgi:methionyl aminopeptidase
MRVVGRMTAETLCTVGRALRVGMTTAEIDRLVYEDTVRRGGRPATLNYKGYPSSVCTSRNHVVCHGMPRPDEGLAPGDILNVDVSTFHGGYYGDTSATFYLGEPSPEARHVVETARRCLAEGVAQVREGARLGDIGAAIEACARAAGCSVVRDYGGHGIGRVFHGDPHVSHTGTRGTGVRLKAGMIFTIEPMVNLGGAAVDLLEDGWTVVTRDGSLSAQFEHTVLVTRTGYELLTARPEMLQYSEGLFDGPRDRAGHAETGNR